MIMHMWEYLLFYQVPIAPLSFIPGCNLFFSSTSVLLRNIVQFWIQISFLEICLALLLVWLSGLSTSLRTKRDLPGKVCHASLWLSILFKPTLKLSNTFGHRWYYLPVTSLSLSLPRVKNCVMEIWMTFLSFLAVCIPL